jgi:hypothetical protein
LPGAKAEAEKLIPLFVANGLETTPSINEDETGIVTKIVTKSYKIIHIASHGIVGDTENEPTGVVLGDNIVFTSADFNSISIVPEFVFINCCSSNDYNVDVAAKMRKKYNLAASVGTQLIQMGVKAAIVTGWEIDDAGAATFCDTFYKNMFDGKTFGEAVRSARQATYDQAGYSNTWGAYQCYGDPFYTFKTASSAAASKKASYADVEEVVYELDNFMSEISSSSKRKTTKESERRVAGIIAALYPEWKIDGRVVERLAELYRVFDMLKEALEYYEQMFLLENAAYKVKAVEQYYITIVRYAQLQSKTKEITPTKAKNKIKEAIEGLKKLNGETVERHTLIASAYRRMFDVDNTDTTALIHAAYHYRMAFEYEEKGYGNINYYPYFNWLHFALLLSSYKADKKNKHLLIPGGIEEMSKRALEYATQADSTEPGFYKKSAASSFHIAALLATKAEAEVAGHQKAIINNFNWAWTKDGNSSERDSFIDYIGFLIPLMERLLPKAKMLRDAKVKALQNVLKAIKK